MASVTIQLDEQTQAALEAAAGKVGDEPAKFAAKLLRDALTALDNDGIGSLGAQRKLVGALVDQSPWNNSIDAEWDDYQP